MILVDAVTKYETKLKHKQWSHMVSTLGRDELVAMAKQLGMQERWIQTDSFMHFDVTPPRRAHAVRLGAIEVPSKELLFANFDYANRRPRQKAEWFEYVSKIAEQSADPRIHAAIMGTLKRVQVAPE